MVKYERVVALLKCLLAAYVITGIMLMLIAAVLYKFQIGENVVNIGIIVVYILSSLVSGILYAKGAKSRRFLWGLAAGLSYFAIICLISVLAEPEALSNMTGQTITTLLICAGSGMLGGMLG